MKETPLSKKIRDGLKRDFGVIMHKTHGGPFGESGAADLYGTLPGGRAIYVETKAPKGSKNNLRARIQKAWLAREAKLGAFTMFAPKNYAEVLCALRDTGLREKSAQLDSIFYDE